MAAALGGAGYEVQTAANVRQGLEVFEARTPDVVVTDLQMPGGDGLMLVRAIRERDALVPIVIATGHATLGTANQAIRDGATGTLMKPFTVKELVAELEASMARTRTAQDAMRYRLIRPILDGLALTLTAAIEARHLETAEHCQQLGLLGEATAAALGLSETEQTMTRFGGFLHDLGKIGIPDRVLLKPDQFTDDEYDEIRRHSEIGARIVGSHEGMQAIAAIVRHHHERWDGRGYPDHVVGADIPIGARIIAVADAFDAMTSDRVYRNGLPDAIARAELRRNAGSQFDAAVVEGFEAVLDELGPHLARARHGADGIGVQA